MQAALAAELDPQAIYEVVGDKIEEVYDAQAVSISTYDEATGLLDFPYLVERGRAAADRSAHADRLLG